MRHHLSYNLDDSVLRNVPSELKDRSVLLNVNVEEFGTNLVGCLQHSHMEQMCIRVFVEDDKLEGLTVHSSLIRNLIRFKPKLCLVSRALASVCANLCLNHWFPPGRP